jgi:hypothetical protein
MTLTNIASDLPLRFLKQLDPIDSKKGIFTYQTFPDRKDHPEAAELTSVIAGPAKDRLLDLHAHGAGIYVTVNRTDGKGRKSKNITHVRAVWREADDPDLPPLPLEPTMIVETSPGHHHEYLLIDGDWPADEQGRADFAIVMERMVETYGSDKSAKDLCRVLRVPGFLHRKTSTPHLVRIASVKTRRYTRAEILAAFPPVLRRAEKPKRDFIPRDNDEQRIADALNRINADDRDVWLEMGMALKQELGDHGRHLWDQWSSKSDKYDEDDQERVWRSFKSNRIGIGTLFHRAIESGWTDAQASSATAEASQPNAHTRRRGATSVLNAEKLNQMTFGPIKYVVPEYIVEGLTLFAGKPKVGKSWLLLHVAFAVAEGGLTLGNVRCEQGDVLYCALEDNPRRLQSRLTKLFGASTNWPANLDFVCEMPRLAEGGLDFIRTWIEKAGRPRLVIIDTLAMVRMPKRGDQSPYEADYAAVQELGGLALKYGVAIVLVHHLRKAEADDVFDTISGTLGLTGAPDTIMIIQRSNNGTTLHAKGRDLIEIEKAIKFDPGTCTWAVLGEAAAIRKSTERVGIVDALQDAGAEPLGPRQIATHTGMKSVNIRQLLTKLLAEGVVKKASYGKYTLATVPSVTTRGV